MSCIGYQIEYKANAILFFVQYQQVLYFKGKITLINRKQAREVTL